MLPKGGVGRRNQCGKARGTNYHKVCMWVLFGLFLMFFNFHRLDLYHNKNSCCISQIYNETSAKKQIENRISPDLVMVIIRCMFVGFLIGYSHMTSQLCVWRVVLPKVEDSSWEEKPMWKGQGDQLS